MTPPLTGGILAGGRGSRMGGIDKGLVTLHGKPLIAHVIEQLAPQVDTLLINANRNIAQYAAFGHPIVRDQLDGHQGPLAGFAALLDACKTDWLVTAPCDGPCLPPDLAARLWQARKTANADIAVAHDGQRLQPVHALLPRRLLPDLQDWLARGERKIALWYAQHHYVHADFSDCAEVFQNLNTPEERQAAEQAINPGFR